MNFQEINEPELQVVLRALDDKINANLNCVKIGIIKEFNNTNQTATVQLTTKRMINLKSLNPDDSPIYVDYPLLLDCPVFILGGKNSYISFADLVNSECLVLFNDREIDNWFESGNIQPFTSWRMHDLSDGIVLAGIRSLPNLINNYNTDGLQIADTSSVTINTPMTTVKNLTVKGDFIVTGSQVISGGTWD